MFGTPCPFRSKINKAVTEQLQPPTLQSGIRLQTTVTATKTPVWYQATNYSYITSYKFAEKSAKILEKMFGSLEFGGVA